MKPPLRSIGIPNVILMVLLGFLLIFPAGAIAQDKSGGGNQLHDAEKLKQAEGHLISQETGQVSPTLNPVMSGVNLNSLDGDYMIFEHDQMWNRNPSNINPDWNFPLFRQGQPAGNINGDSLNGNPRNDYVVTGRTGVFSDSTWKTAVFFGDISSEEPEDIIERKLKPVGDINGDGYADAVAVDHPSIKSVEIYKGTNSGYQGTGISLDNLEPGRYQILGFVDFNQDGLGDIFAYSETSGEILIAEGEESFNITVSVYYEVLSFSSKKVMVKNIDEDSQIEIVEFSGSNGDGSIEVLEVFRTESGLSFDTQIYPLDFFKSFDDASYTDLHLIDVNGNENDDIYISLGRDSPKYIMEYDTVDNFYQNPNEILNGELVPAGDLNNDGKHDFIIGDPNNDFAPYIAYGSQDLPANISLDIPLEGYAGSDWDWEMQYNPYSGFGDLNGDGIDDVLLAHREFSGSERLKGRRVLLGDESESDNSEFYLYSYENFHSRIFEVEELGDVDNDGVDDFAMILSDQGRVEIYYGGTDISQSPDQTINSGVYISAVTSGDFTGDDINDIVALSWEWDRSYIEIFEGGSSFTKIKSIAVSDFQDSEIVSAYGVNNIGDTNGNGSSDFLIGSGTARDTTDGDVYLNEAYIFHGGSSISLSTDPPLDLDPSNEFPSTYLSAAASATALGDIDGDGLGDFAVGTPLKNRGEVSLYFSGSNEPIRFASSTGSFFGLDMVSGNFNGDDLKDLAVSVPFADTVANIYYGKEDFDTAPAQSLVIPDFFSEENGSAYMLPSLEAIPDYNHNGKDELLVGSSGIFNNHAAIYTYIDSESSKASLIKGANADAALGGTYFVNKYGTMATGDFTDNGELDVVISQFNDNSDAYESSRIFRYALSLPIAITSVEDVPEDQGGKVQVNVGGYLMDKTFGFDSLSVQRMKGNNEWNTLVTDEGAESYDISVPKTQPTNNDEVDNSYTFRVVAFTDTVIAKSQELTGRALDNIAPEVVQGVEITEENDSKVLSWQGLEISDLDSYFIYRIEDNGELSDRPQAIVEETEYTFSDSFDGVQNFVISARDIHNNLGETSLPVSVVFPKTVTYDFKAGWNLITLAVDDDSAKSDLQDLSSGSIYQYKGGYQEVEQVEEGEAYWIKFTDANNPEFRGMPLTELSVELREGWNLIGGIGGELPVSLIDDPDEIIIPETVYNLEDGEVYSNADTLEPTQGYWIRTSAAGKITLTHPRLLEGQSEELNNNVESLAKSGSAENITEAFNQITISDDDHSTELYFGQKLPNDIDKRRFSLPPLPPGDFFDARFDGDMRLVENDKVDIRLNTIAEKSLKVKIEAGSTAEANQFMLKEFADGELQAKHTVNNSEEISLMHKETDSIILTPVGISEVGQQEVPDEFDLEQNYPNPFNPTTQIQYSVAEATDVKIDVYNILGRRIVTLVNERQERGTYEVTFDGSKFASGIYLYRLQAGDYISTKKFILAK